MAMQYGRPTMNTPRARALGLSDGRKANEERAAAEAQSALEAAEQQLKIESQRQDAAVKRQRAEAQAAAARRLRDAQRGPKFGLPDDPIDPDFDYQEALAAEEKTTALEKALMAMGYSESDAASAARTGVDPVKMRADQKRAQDAEQRALEAAARQKEQAARQREADARARRAEADRQAERSRKSILDLVEDAVVGAKGDANVAIRNLVAQDPMFFGKGANANDILAARERYLRGAAKATPRSNVLTLPGGQVIDFGADTTAPAADDVDKEALAAELGIDPDEFELFLEANPGALERWKASQKAAGGGQ